MAQLVPAPVPFRKTSSSSIFLVSTLLTFGSVPATIHREALQVIFSSSDSAAFHLPSQGRKALSPSTSSIHSTFSHYRAKSLHMSFTAPFSIRQPIPVHPL